MRADFALEWQGNIALEPTSYTLFMVATILYFVVAILYFFYMAYRSSFVSTIATGIGILGALFHFTSLVYRALAAGYTPLSNMYEYTSAFALFIVLTYFVVLLYTKNNSFGGFSFGLAFLMMGVALQFYRTPSTLMPALKSYWLELHVLTMVISSGAFGVAFLYAVLYLIKERKLKGGNLSKSGLLTRIPSLEVLDNLSYRTSAFAFPLWTIGVIAGAVWAEQAWGRYWGWDPKETWSFITWLIYAGYLHARITAGWRGKSAAYLSVIGFVAVVFTFIGVNLVLSGLHSYK